MFHWVEFLQRKVDRTMLSSIILCQPAPQSSSLFCKILSNRVTWSEPAAVVVPALIVGASANNASAIGGAFTFNVNNAPSNTNWNNGCGQSYRSTHVVTSKTYNTTAKNALRNPHPLVKIARCRTGIVDRRISAIRNFGRR